MNFRHIIHALSLAIIKTGDSFTYDLNAPSKTLPTHSHIKQNTTEHNLHTIYSAKSVSISLSSLERNLKAMIGNDILPK